MTALPFRATRLGPLSIRWDFRTLIVCAALLGVIAVLGLFAMGTGSMALSPGEVLASLFGGQGVSGQVVNRIRLPRLLTGLFVGASLGMAGAIFQSISRNALGSPDIIGFTTGAATGAVAQIVIFNAGPVATALAAVGGGLATAAMVYLLALKGRTTGGYRLVLVGIGMGAILAALNTILLVRGNLDDAISAQVWLSGSLNARTWQHAASVMLVFAALAPLALSQARKLEIMEMGDDSALQFGVPVERTRLLMMLAGVGLTAVATAAAGPIAFVALAAPQLVKRLTGAAGIPLLSGALMGALLMVAADLLSQHLPVRAMMPIGLTTGLLGGVYLLWLLTRTRSV